MMSISGSARSRQLEIDGHRPPVTLGPLPDNDEKPTRTETNDEPSRRRGAHSRARTIPARSRWHVGLVAVVVLVIVGFLSAGGFGISRYVETFWLYRGFPPPAHPRVVVVGSGPDRRRIRVEPGTVGTIEVKSAALGNQAIPVIVYLPPNYNIDVGQHYPVLYLLHGFPGSPSQFINVGDVAVHSDVLIAEHHIRPMIIVMPSGAKGFFTDNEWANSIRPHNDWETFVAHDLVQSIDQRYRTIEKASERGIGGLSEGGYGAVNIAFHHVGEFDLIEGWSAYYLADVLPTLFGNNPKLLTYNSPDDVVGSISKQLKVDHTYLWLYSGRHDVTRPGNVRFSEELSALGIAHSWASYPGFHHTWKLWRAMMVNSLVTASNYFEHGYASS